MDNKGTDEADAQQIRVGRSSAISNLRDSLTLPADLVIEGDVYKYNSNPRGYGVIISNEDFKRSSGYKPRKGDEVDVQNMEHLMNYIGLEVSVFKDVDETEMLSALDKLKKKFRDSPADLCMVSIMTHGADYNEIVDINGKEINVEKKIFQLFYNNNAKELIGVPKIFLLQCCRGEELGYAETVVLADEKYGPPPGASAPKTRTVQIPIVKDIIIMNATVPGFVANRNTLKGSWFVQCLVKVFLDNVGKGVDVREMLEMVSKEMSQMVSVDKTRMQTAEIANRGFLKKLYLTPVEEEKSDTIFSKLKNAIKDVFH